MALKGPITKDTSSLAVGLAQVRVGASATHIAATTPQLTASDSIGALTQTRLVAEREFLEHMVSFPRIRDYTIPISESASLECTAEEISPFTLALANGIDPTSGYDAAHSGEIALGGLNAPAYLRMEAMYTFPNGTNYMHIIFPRAQVTSQLEVDLQATDWSGIPITFIANNASSDVSGGNAVWDDKPMGAIQFT